MVLSPHAALLCDLLSDESRVGLSLKICVLAKPHPGGYEGGVMR